MSRRHVIGVAVTDGTPMLEFAVPYEIFGIDRSDIVDPWYEFRLCAAEPGALSTAGGLRIEATGPLEGLREADTLLVTALSRRAQVSPPPALVEEVRRAHREGRRIVSICSGAYVLAAAGVLDGRRATTHWMNTMDFTHRFPNVVLDPNVLYVDEGDVLTSAGTGAAIDVCLHIVRRDHGSVVANEVARRMVVPPHRDGGQSQFVRPSVRGPAPDDGLARVLDWALHHLDQPLTVADLAARGHTTPRTFSRRFRDSLGTTPLQWLLDQRVRLAQELLEGTDDGIDLIAERAGFGTAANLRRHFGRVTSVSPHTYRHVFRHRATASSAS
jgi:transcriptional regulator GlxA family with amidase domain